MTKGGGFPCGARGHHRADCHLRIVDDDTINAPCHPLSALGNRSLVQWGLETLAKRLDALGQRRDMHVLVRLGLASPPLLRSTMLGLGHLLATTLELLARTHLCQGDIEEPSW